MSWIGVILAVIQLVNKLLSYGQQQKWIREGEDRAVAKALAEVLRKTEYAKQALAEFTGKSDADVDDFLRSLEPGEPSEPRK